MHPYGRGQDRYARIQQPFGCAGSWKGTYEPVVRGVAPEGGVDPLLENGADGALDLGSYVRVLPLLLVVVPAELGPDRLVDLGAEVLLQHLVPASARREIGAVALAAVFVEAHLLEEP